MPDGSPLFAVASRAAARERLSEFLPRAGRDYQAERNYDRGPGARANVSLLSPYLRHRLLTEEEVVRRVLDRHSLRAAEKYLQEVLWRTYWKGWLELRPEVWARYCAERDAVLAGEPVGSEGAGEESSGAILGAVAEAEAGRSGIACFDAWAEELRETGYLHNHARMWFASIWVFTLRLPWQLGADFFMRHLLDGDPASNTLSWRWVAGLQTKGKTYLARPDNIARFTEGRFRPDPGELAPSAVPLSEAPLPPPRPLAPLPAELGPGRHALLIADDDLCPESLIGSDREIAAVAGLSSVAGRSPQPVAQPVRRFVDQALADALSRAQAAWSCPVMRLDDGAPVESVLSWAGKLGETPIAMIQSPAGPGRDRLDPVVAALQAGGRPVVVLRRPWDAAFWPQATKGFFPFKEKIGKTLAALGVTAWS